MNGFLLSDLGRQFLKAVLEHENIQKITNTRNKAFEYIKKYLNAGVTGVNINTLGCFLGYRPSSLSNGATIKENLEIYTKLFGPYKKMLRFEIYSEEHEDRQFRRLREFANSKIPFKNAIENSKNEFTLSHSIISILVYNSNGTHEIAKGHQITGGVDSTGRKFIYDSGTGRYAFIDWTTPKGRIDIKKYIQTVKVKNSTKHNFNKVNMSQLRLRILSTWINKSEIRKLKQRDDMNRAMAMYLKSLGAPKNFGFGQHKIPSISNSKLSPKLSPLRVSRLNYDIGGLSQIQKNKVSLLINAIKKGQYNSNIRNNNAFKETKKKALTKSLKSVHNAMVLRKTTLVST